MNQVPVTAIDPLPPDERDRKPVRRLAIVRAGFTAFALLVAMQFLRWMVVERDSWIEKLTRVQPYQEEIAPPRGLILDRKGAVLALNNYDYTISAAPNRIGREETLEVSNRLAAILGRPRDELAELLKGDGFYSPIERHVPRQVGKIIISADLPGIIVRPLAVRVYPEHTLAAHTMGFVAGDDKGYYGVEGFYDKVLKGKAGLRDTGWNPWDQPVSFTDRRSRGWTVPQQGHSLVLTIDRTLQYLVEQELKDAVERYGAESGCIVVMDPKTGALLALASYPSYDPNRFAEIDKELLIDPVIGRQYEPGSTFKIVTMAGALDAGVAEAVDLYNDVGYIEVGGRILRNWDERAYGTVTMIDIVVRSLNTGIAHVSTLLGPSRFYHYVSRFGFGRKTGVDMQGEVSGTVRQQGDLEWHESDLGTNAFGQGLAATPLQMVVAVGAVANRGFMMRPYVVEQAAQGGRSVSAKQVAIRQVISERAARILTEMMIEAVERGAPLAKVAGYCIAGKTGTAQTPVVGGYDPQLTVASFVGFAPADDPRFVVLVKLDKPTTSSWGTTTAAPTFANVARILFSQLAIPPDQARVAAN